MGVTAAPGEERRYRGWSSDERRRERRERLIDAAIGLYRERGYRETSVKAICDAARLTERYFYEAFANREAILVAAFERVMAALMEAMRAAAAGAGAGATAAVLSTYYAALRDDPAAARVFLVEITGISAAVDAAIGAFLHDFGALLAATLGGPAADPLDRAGAVGGVVHIAVAWREAGYDRPLAQVVAAGVRLCRVLAPVPVPAS